MKKIISVLLILTLCLSSAIALAACSIIPHNHSYATEWSNDEEYHWHFCTASNCKNIVDKANHTWDEGIVKSPATKDTDGVMAYTCTVCGYVKEEILLYVAPSGQYTVTEEEWNAFMANTNYSIRSELYDKNGAVSAIMEIKATETSTYSSNNSEVVITILMDNIWYQVVNFDGEYIGIPMAEEAFRNAPVGTFLMGRYPDFALWTYDEAEKAYCVKGDDADNFMARIYFENGVFTHMRIDEKGKQQNITVSAIGTTTIDIPEFTIVENPESNN